MVDLPDDPTSVRLVAAVADLMRPSELDDAEVDQIIEYVGAHVRGPIALGGGD